MDNSNIRATRGIRYATAARFAAPELLPYAPGSELGRAGSLCPQVPGMMEQMLGQDLSQMNEDCLFLDVFAPEGAAPSSLPVLVWIHGGAYTNGSGSVPWYDGSRHAARGAVVVTINYRLGVFGYLGAGNWGTLDQICALQWVQANISQFGGDAGNVTIFGESAGGSAVVSLLAAPSARGLFHKAWSMSPSIRQLRSIDSARTWERTFLETAGVASVEAAAALSVEDLLAAQATVMAMPNQNFDMFTPAAGGEGLPVDILGAAAANPLPWCVGTNRDENLLFDAFNPELSGADEQKWTEHLTAKFGGAAETARAAYEAARPGANPLTLISAVNTDHTFRRPAQALCEARNAHGNPSWMYWFTWGSPAFGGVLGSAHALDIPFAFDNLHTQGAEMLLGPVDALQPIAARFADEIHAFARTGAPTWTAFDTTSRPTLRIDAEVSEINDPEPELRALHA